jgi:hypothetical protein
MARQNAFSVEFDVKALLKAEDSLSSIDDTTMRKAALGALNEVTATTYNTNRRRMNAGINLSDSYISSKMDVAYAASPSKLESTITAGGGNTILGHYGARPQLVPAKNASRSKGSAKLGVPAGIKQSGQVQVAVTRNSPKVMREKAFMMPLKYGNGLGVFTKDPRTGKYVHRYGPSVYQLFRAQLELHTDEILDDLEDAVIAAQEGVIRKAFT